MFVGLVGPLLLHFLHPISLTLGVFTFDLVPLLLRHGMVASHALLGLFGLEGLVLPIGSHTGHSFVVASTVHGLHVLDPIQGRVLALPIPFLMLFVFLWVSLCPGLARFWYIHALAPILGPHTRPPTHATFGRDWVSPEPRHDGPAAAAQSYRGVDDSICGSAPALGLNAWLGTGYRPTDSTLGLWQSPLGSEAVWAVWAV